MAMDIVVQPGTELRLSEEAPQGFESALTRLQVRTLGDLVDLGLVSSREALGRMLESARQVTARALTSREAFTPFVPIRGTRQPDLRRFGAFLAASQEPPMEQQSFWQLAREIEPRALATLKPTTDLSTVLSPGMAAQLGRYWSVLVNDVTVEQNATLVVGKNIKKFSCHDLLIKKGGRLIVQSSGAFIQAHSIQGLQ